MGTFTDIERCFDGLVSAGTFSGWIRERSRPFKTFSVELWEKDTLLCLSTSGMAINDEMPSGRYYLSIPDSVKDGNCHSFEIKCPEAGILLARPTCSLQSTPSLADFPFLADESCEATRSARHIKSNMPTRLDAYEWKLEKLKARLAEIEDRGGSPAQMAEAWAALGRLDWEQGDEDAALVAWMHAAAADPANSAILAECLDFLYWNGHERAARDLLGVVWRSGVPAQCKADEIASLLAPVTFQDFSRLSIQPQRPGISAVVLSYNYARFLKQRLESIASQSLPPEEIVILDDASTDSSVDIIKAFARDSRLPVRIELNSANSGNIFAQWRKGLKAASCDWIWLAECDDFCESGFLGALAPALRDDSVVAAWSDSIPVDEHGCPIGPPYKDHYAKEPVPHPRLERDFTAGGKELLRSGLLQFCALPNASAVVFRKSALPEDMTAILEYTCSGDWWLWRRLALRGSFAYVSSPLNRHRKRRCGAARGVASGEMLEQHIRLHQEMLSLYPCIYGLNETLSVARCLQSEYEAHRYWRKGTASCWLANSREFGEDFRSLLRAMLALSPGALFPPLEELKKNEDRRIIHALVAGSRFFDKDFYLMRNPDVRRAGIDPVQHYIDSGWREGRMPCDLSGALAQALFQKSGRSSNPILYLENFPY